MNRECSQWRFNIYKMVPLNHNVIFFHESFFFPYTKGKPKLHRLFISMTSLRATHVNPKRVESKIHSTNKWVFI